MKKYLSRKFIVFVIATILVATNKITDWTWLVVAIIWMGLEAYLDTVRRG